MQPVSHSDYVLQQLCSQLEYGFLCDCSIAVGDVHFRAHRVVLAACSSYFHKLFVNQPVETSQLFLSSQAVSPDHFDLILQLMYTGRLESSPSNPEQFKASLNFLKLYNAAHFCGTTTAAAVGERENEEGVPLASGSSKNNPMVFGVQLCQDKNTSMEAPVISRPPVGPNHLASVSIKPEVPEDMPELQTFLCHHCGLDFEEQASLRDHLQLHAKKPFHCPLCGLAFESAQGLQEHVSGCLHGMQEQVQSRAPEVKQEVELAERFEGDGCCQGREAASKDLGPGLKMPKVEYADEPPLLLGLSGVTVVRVGGEDADVTPPQSYDGQAEDYELEEGEVRFPGDDDLVLENASDDGSFSSSDSSLDADSAGEDSARTELSEDEATPCGTGPKAPPPTPSAGGGQPACHVSRRSGKVWRCQACEGCRPSEERSRGLPGNRTGSQLGATRGRMRKNAVATRSSSRRGVPEGSGRNGPCHACHDSGGRQQDTRQLPDWEKMQAVERTLAKGAKVPVSSRNKRGPVASVGGKARNHHRKPRHKKDAEAFEGKQRRFAKAPGKRKHNGLREHFCAVCGKGFLQRGHLTEHMATHNKAKQFSCQVCGREFLRERELRLHVAMHTGDARYECQVCGRGSYRKHNHLRHMACHLSQGQAICQVCFEIFRNEADLERHLEIHLYPCVACGEKFKLKKDMVTHVTSCWMKKLLDEELEKSADQGDED
ncbi:zinc finger and BTB domain-containing protein 1-like [Heterodontus francisci]|uniref:zinc finger and BTB domain-containing protein 1-like n=1 Tax=Heterodontus francisci TaxID=7792 RepID=UPI00355BACB8